MNRLTAKTFAAAAVALGALAAATTAHARSDVHFSIGIGAPYGYVQPAPVYVQPAPVYVQPQPVYVTPRPVYGHGHGHYYGHRHGHGRRWGDADRDGVPNAYDRRPHNPYRY